MSEEIPENGESDKQGGEEPARFRVNAASWPSREKTARENAAMCHNPFGCKAGALPWSTFADGSRQDECKACRLTVEKPVVLLPWDEIEISTKCCPMCFWLFGVPKHHLPGYENSGRPDSASDVLEPFEGAALSTSSCPVCGAIPNKAKPIFEAAEAAEKKKGTKGSGARTAQEKLALQILQILRDSLEYRSEKDLYNQLRDYTRSCEDHNDGFNRMRAKIEEIFDREIYATRVLEKKLDTMRNRLAADGYRLRTNSAD